MSNQRACVGSPLFNVFFDLLIPEGFVLRASFLGALHVQSCFRRRA